VPLKGIHPRDRHLSVASPAGGGEAVRPLLATAADPAVLRDFEPTRPGDVLTTGGGPLHRFRSAGLAVLDEEVWHLVLDVEVRSELTRELPMDRARRHQILARAGGRARRARPARRGRYGDRGPCRPHRRPVPARVGERAPDPGGRARPHRLGVAVAAAGDGPQDLADVRRRHRAGRRPPGAGVRLLAGPARSSRNWPESAGSAPGNRAGTSPTGCPTTPSGGTRPRRTRRGRQGPRHAGAGAARPTPVREGGPGLPGGRAVSTTC
jgi:hypothetical protein